MKELTENQLNNINGGAIPKFIIFGGILTFIIGIIDGFSRPLKCN